MTRHNDIDPASEASPLLAQSRPSTSPQDSEAAQGNKDNVEIFQIDPKRRIAIAFGIGLLIFLQASNMSMLTTIQSQVADDLDAYEEVSWFTTAYLIFMSSFAPIMGRLSSLFSPRLCIAISAMIFAVGCLITSFARTFLQFISGRAIAGVGGAGVFSVSIILVIQLSSAKRRGLLMALLNTCFTVGVSLGAISAGALLGVVGWRFLFFAQAPLAVLGGLVLLIAVPKGSSGHKGMRENRLSIIAKFRLLDYVGALTLTSCITFLLAGFSAKRIQILPVVVSLILLPTFVLNELHLAKDPIIPVIVLKSRGVLLSCLATVGFMMCRWVVLFYSPVYAIAVRGWSPAVAGSILIPTNLGFGLGGLIVGWAHIRREGSFYWSTLVAFILFPVTLASLAFATTPTIHPALYITAIFCNGFCVGAALNYSLAHTLHLTVPETHFVVTSLLATFRGFAGSFGSALGGGIFARILHKSLKTGFRSLGSKDRTVLIQRLMGSPALVRSLHGNEKVVAVTSYVDALTGLFWAAVALALLSIVAQAGVGQSGHLNDNQKHARATRAASRDPGASIAAVNEPDLASQGARVA